MAIEPFDLWLDDMRPAPIGWLHAKTIGEAVNYLNTGLVRRASLDHDLGACEDCYKKMQVQSAEEWLQKTSYKAMPHCEHFGSGYDFVCYMEEHNIWPMEKPTVHSANPVGRARMQQVINRKYD